MHDIANLSDGLFEDAVCRRISHHQAGEVGFVSFGASTEISKVDVARFVASNGDDFQAGHHCAGRVGAVSRSRNETNIPIGFTTAGMISSNDQENGVFAWRAGVGLERNPREASDFGEPIFELVKKGLITPRLFQWREGMKLAEFGPAYREHFGAGIEFHRAGAERNHRGS